MLPLILFFVKRNKSLASIVAQKWYRGLNINLLLFSNCKIVKPQNMLTNLACLIKATVAGMYLNNNMLFPGALSARFLEVVRGSKSQKNNIHNIIFLHYCGNQDQVWFYRFWQEPQEQSHLQFPLFLYVIKNLKLLFALMIIIK